MNRTTNIALAVPVIVGVTLAALPAAAAHIEPIAVLRASTTISTSLDGAAKTKADAQVSARITALNNLETRINQMVRVSADEKTSLDESIQSSINDMTSLQTKIDADTDNVTLRADIKSIAPSFRIYLLVMPQGRITAAADRVENIADLFTSLNSKLQLRISNAQAAGANVTALNTSLADMNTKVSDANIQAGAAISEVMGLKPDEGDKTVFASNQAALKDARAKITAAAKDLKTARQDAGSIVKALSSLKVSGSATASTTTTTNQ